MSNSNKRATLDLNPFEEALEKCKKGFVIAFVFSFGINIAMLITPLYALQVLDRVVSSGNVYTLLMLSMIIGSVYLVYGLLNITRSFILTKIGEWLDSDISPTIFSYSIAAAAKKQGSSTSQLLRDFQTVKGFITGAVMTNMFDAPWTIAYLAVIFWINTYIGAITVIGGAIVIGFAFLNAYATTKTLGEATEHSIRGMTQADLATRNAEVVEAMGMMDNVSNNWSKYNKAALVAQSAASYRNGIISNISRLMRNILTMAVTGIAAYVIVTTNSQAMTTGGMIASSILVGRALAPFDNMIEMWKTITSTRKSYKKIMDAFKSSTLREEAMVISDIKGHLTFENVYYSHPSDKNLLPGAQADYVLKGVSFSVSPGEIVAIIGPSASGKSTIAKVMMGVWQASSGSVRLDGGDIYKWNRHNFGEHVGYIPQGIELFSGSIKQNIARMAENEEIDMVEVESAAKFTKADEMILRLPDGYDTDLGNLGNNLSGGQKQRIAIARAFYKKPRLVVLDEPNASLDMAGEEALSHTLKLAKIEGITVIVISHRPSILSVVDKILMIQDGAVAAYGKTDDVLRQVKLLTSEKVKTDDK